MKNTTARKKLSGDDFQKLLACLKQAEPMDDLRTHMGPTSDPSVKYGEVEDAR